jgi:hypothetical protein
VKASRLAVALLAVALGPGLAAAPVHAVTRNVTLEIPQDTLNRLAARLGTPAAHGMHQAASGFVPWRWMITGARFTVAAGGMTFSATVDATVGPIATRITRTVPAAMTFDASTGRLRIAIGAFTVPVQSAGTTIVQVDVARLYSLAVPLEPQELAVPLLDGETREILLGAEAASAEYLAGRVVVTIDVGFPPPAPNLPRPGPRPLALPVPDGGGPATGRGTVRVYESMLDELARRVEPLRLSGHYQFKRGCGCVPGVGCGCAISVSCDWTARVRDVRFDIKPSRIEVRGDVRASWCNQSFDAVATTTADVSYVRSVLLPGLGRGRGHEAWVAVRTSPTDVQPVFRIQGYEVKLPVRINVGPSMSWRIPVSTGVLHYETVDGPLPLRLSPSTVSLVKRSGYLEVHALVGLW